MLNKEQEVYVATGDKSFSGTGRNRQTTRHVRPVTNYQIIPSGIEVTNSSGSSMRLVDKDNILAPYWSVIGSKSEYRVLLDGKGVKPIVQTKTGNKTVGAKLRYKDAEGNLFLLPYIDFELDEYTYENEEDGKTYWTDEAIAFGKKFVSSICALDKIAKSTGEFSAKPDWLTQNKYVLPKEENIRGKLIGVESKIDELQKKKEQFE